MSPDITPLVPFYPARPFTAVGAIDQEVFSDWLCEPKFNGWRFLYDAERGRAWNRKGQVFSVGTLVPLRSSWSATEFWLDCEYIGKRTDAGAGSIVVIDCIRKGGDAADYVERRSRFEHLPEIPYDDIPVGVLMRFPSFRWEQASADIEIMKAVNQWHEETIWEGIVLKHPKSLYPIQKSSPDKETSVWAKCRFV